MEKCPCGSDALYSDCCEPKIKGAQSAQTAEELMRSRYAAFTRNEIDYILATIHPSQREEHSERSIRNWSKKSEWLEFNILETQQGGPDDDTGMVEFTAYYREKGIKKLHHEIAEFKKQDGTWYFYDGNAPVPEQVVRNSPKIGRNDPCPCGSGKKFKKCCGG